MRYIDSLLNSMVSRIFASLGKCWMAIFTLQGCGLFDSTSATFSYCAHATSRRSIFWRHLISLQAMHSDPQTSMQGFFWSLCKIKFQQKFFYIRVLIEQFLHQTPNSINKKRWILLKEFIICSWWLAFYIFW